MHLLKINCLAGEMAQPYKKLKTPNKKIKSIAHSQVHQSQNELLHRAGPESPNILLEGRQCHHSVAPGQGPSHKVARGHWLPSQEWEDIQTFAV